MKVEELFGTKITRDTNPLERISSQTLDCNQWPGNADGAPGSSQAIVQCYN